MTLEAFDPAKLPLVWEWVCEYPDHNLDDFSPKTYGEFHAAMEGRADYERIWLVSELGKTCGIVAYRPWTPRSGTFNGICFAKEVHGAGIAQRAVRAVLDELYALGVEKISACYFADNGRVRRFLEKLGAADEGLLRKHTMRGGEAIDVRMIAFFKERE